MAETTMGTIAKWQIIPGAELINAAETKAAKPNEVKLTQEIIYITIPHTILPKIIEATREKYTAAFVLGSLFEKNAVKVPYAKSSKAMAKAVGNIGGKPPVKAERKRGEIKPIIAP